MKKKILRILALVLICVLLAGCADTERILSYFAEDYVAYSDMEYTRPDMQAIDQALSNAIEASKGDDLDRIVDLIYAYYDVYDGFYTNYALADIRYCADLTDLYWVDEYNYCADNSAAVDAGLEELYYALAQSPCRDALEGEDYFGASFFDSYEGENEWDAEFVALLEQESQLQSRYYELSEEALEYEPDSNAYYDACGREMAELLVELIRLRQEIAAYWGYADYVQFANDLYYNRDYTMEQSAQYLLDIAHELTPLYQAVYNSEKWNTCNPICTESETYDYVRAAAQSMGGTVLEAFTLMDQAGLYDISYGANKYDSSFEVYLTSYWEPFIFMNPSGVDYDKLVFAHEFGHFCNDYASYGSYADTDVTEFFSQGMEYLSLCYTDAPEELVWLKLADSLCTFVEQAAFATFEQRMYALSEEALTVENLRKLYREVAELYGFGSTGYTDWEFVQIGHFYTDPMYIISYVVSNDAALQLYQLELAEKGAGLSCYQENLDTQAYCLLEFLSSAQLQSPFEEGRMAAVRQTLEEALK